MTTPAFLIRCVACGGAISRGELTSVCGACGASYPVEDGILVLRRADGVDLRMDEELLDLHRLREERLYFDRPITSEVEYAARRHSVDFSQLHAEWLAPHTRGAVVLDLGCGQVPYLNAFGGQAIREYLALDLDPVALRIALAHFQGGFPFTPVQHGVYDVPLPSSSIDVAISCEVIEHLERPAEHLRELYRVCKPGAYLSLSTPCASIQFYPHQFLGLLARPRHLRQGLRDWYERVNPHERWSKALEWHPGLRPSILRRWVREAGFEVVRHQTRMWYYHTPLRLGWRSFELFERLGLRQAGSLYGAYLRLTERALGLGLPGVKWLGTRQFVLCRKALESS